MVILFEHVSSDLNYDALMGKFKYKGFHEKDFKKTFRLQYDNIRYGWINSYFCNHDQPRVVSRWGDEEEHWAKSAKMFGMLYTYLRGSPFIFQGEEIGMTNWKFTKEQADDLEFFGFYKKLVEDLKLLTHDEMMAASHKIARDTARTPVQWSDEAHGGFTTGKPWISV